ncbi:unnamed protein product [Rhodiola kirilowii]
MGRHSSLRSKAADFVSDLTSVIRNPTSDKLSKHPPPSSHDEAVDARGSGLSNVEKKEGCEDDPDTYSFSAYLRSFFVSSESGNNSTLEEKTEGEPTGGEDATEGVMKENRGRRSLISRGKQSVGRIISQAARFTGYRSQGLERKSNGDVHYEDEYNSRPDVVEMKGTQIEVDHVATNNLPATSEISVLLSERTRSSLYASLPALVQGRKWVLLYSTLKNGISLSTLYRRSMLWPGLSLLVVGDRKGAIFGGLVEAPLRPSSMRRYQGSNNSFVFTNTTGHPVVYRPTGVNRYYTVCALEYLALGGGSHFALYLDQDLLTGSSRISETYGNPCLAHTEDFDVKEVELWGFVYASKFDEVIAMSHSEAAGICRW